jgi:hypothetical protein
MTIKKDANKSKPVKRKKSGSRKRTVGGAASRKGAAYPSESRPPGMGKNKWKKLKRRLSDNSPDVTTRSGEPHVESVPGERTACPSENKPPGMGKNKWKKLKRRSNVNAPDQASDVISTSSESVTKETKEDVDGASAEQDQLDNTNSDVTTETLTKVSKKVKKKDDAKSEIAKETLSKDSRKVERSRKDVGSASAEQDKLDDAKSEDSKETLTKVSTSVKHGKDVVTRRQTLRKKH